MAASQGFARARDGTAIAYDVAGDGPVVVFVHGITNRRTAWTPVSQQLTRDHTCVRLDLRGHGESGFAADYAMATLVGDVRAVVEHLDLGEPALAGHSLGASVAAVYAAAFGARAVVLVDGSLRFGDFAAQVQPHAADLRGPDTLAALMTIERELGLGPYPGLDEMERRVLAFPREVVLGLWAQLLATPPEELTATAEALLPRIGCPLLSLHGDPPPADYEPWLRSLIPSATVEVWPGTGHLLHLIEPERFAERLRRFVAGA